MTTVALLMAGGRGNRMGQDLPKQFLSIDDEPVIAYTMQVFQADSRIDAILVVCIPGWETVMQAYANQFGITKLKGICRGGDSNFASIHYGCILAKKLFDDDPLILVHDGVRPNVSQQIIDECITTAETNGNAITAIPTTEVLLSSSDGTSSQRVINRETTKRTQTPQAFRLSELLDMQKQTVERNLNPKAPCEMAIDLGRKVFFSPGSEKNLKMTTLDDIEIFEALLHARSLTWKKEL